jgi:hypothetical protein
MSNPIAIATRLWAQSGQPVPRHLFCRYRGEVFATISDHESVCLFMSQSRSIFAAVRSKCIPNGSGYEIPEDLALQIISCPSKKHYSNLEKFVMDSILPVLLP